MTAPDVIPPEAVGSDFVPALADDVTFVLVEDEAVVYAESSGTLHLLNPVAALVCQLFGGRATIAELTDDLTDAFQAPRREIESDVLALVADLGRRGLISGVERGRDLADSADRIERALVDGC